MSTAPRLSQTCLRRVLPWSQYVISARVHRSQPKALPRQAGTALRRTARQALRTGIERLFRPRKRKWQPNRTIEVEILFFHFVVLLLCSPTLSESPNGPATPGTRSSKQVICKKPPISATLSESPNGPATPGTRSSTQVICMKPPTLERQASLVRGMGRLVPMKPHACGANSCQEHTPSTI